MVNSYYNVGTLNCFSQELAVLHGIWISIQNITNTCSEWTKNIAVRAVLNMYIVGIYIISTV